MGRRGRRSTKVTARLRELSIRHPCSRQRPAPSRPLGRCGPKGTQTPGSEGQKAHFRFAFPGGPGLPKPPAVPCRSRKGAAARHQAQSNQRPLPPHPAPHHPWVIPGSCRSSASRPGSILTTPPSTELRGHLGAVAICQPPVHTHNYNSNSSEEACGFYRGFYRAAVTRRLLRLFQIRSAL